MKLNDIQQAELLYNQARINLIYAVQNNKGNEEIIQKLREMIKQLRPLTHYYEKVFQDKSKIFQPLIQRAANIESTSKSTQLKTYIRNLGECIRQAKDNSRSYRVAYDMAMSRMRMLVKGAGSPQVTSTVRSQLYAWFYYSHNVSSQMTVQVYSNLNRPQTQRAIKVGATTIMAQKATGLTVRETARIATSTLHQNASKSCLATCLEGSAGVKFCLTLGVVLSFAEGTNYLFNDRLHSVSKNNNLALDLSLFTMSPIDTYYAIQDIKSQKNSYVIASDYKITQNSPLSGQKKAIKKISCLSGVASYSLNQKDIFLKRKKNKKQLINYSYVSEAAVESLLV